MRIISIHGIASLFDVSHQTINTWQAEGFPVALRGGPGVPSEYESADCIAWLVERDLGKVRTESPTDRLARVRADTIEMNNDERRKTLIPADKIEPALKAGVLAAREMWRGEPPRLAREVQGKAPQEIEAVLSEAFDAFLVRLSQWPAGVQGGGKTPPQTEHEVEA